MCVFPLASVAVLSAPPPHLFIAALPPEVLVALNQPHLSSGGEGGAHTSTRVRNKLTQQVRRVGLDTPHSKGQEGRSGVGWGGEGGF